MWALAERPDRARALLAELEAQTDSNTRRIREPQIHALRAFIALSEGRLPDAILEIRAADEGPCGSCVLPYMAMVYDKAGNADSAIAIYERYLGTREMSRIALDATFRAMTQMTHQRLGELYDARGHREKAAAHFSEFIELWRNADPELQPRVEEARRRLALLRASQG
jgi:eukaryotic-like serine/threonine-protein kinase